MRLRVRFWLRWKLKMYEMRVRWLCMSLERHMVEVYGEGRSQVTLSSGCCPQLDAFRRLCGLFSFANSITALSRVKYPSCYKSSASRRHPQTGWLLLSHASWHLLLCTYKLRFRPARQVLLSGTPNFISAFSTIFSYIATHFYYRGGLDVHAGTVMS
jgi:hypothetical protein